VLPRTPLRKSFELFKEALALVEKGDFASAEEKYTVIVEEFQTPQNRNRPETRTLLARAFSDRGNTRVTLMKLDEALLDFSEAIELQPQDKEFYINRALAYEDKGASSLAEGTEYSLARQFMEAALDDYEHGLVLDPSNPRLHVNRGDVLTSLGRHTEALQSYRRALTLDSYSQTNYAKVALTEVQVGNLDRGRYMVDVLLRKNPNYPEMLLASAALHWATGDFASAADEANMSMMYDPRLTSMDFVANDLRWPPMMMALLDNLRIAGASKRDRVRTVERLSPSTSGYL